MSASSSETGRFDRGDLALGLIAFLGFAGVSWLARGEASVGLLVTVVPFTAIPALLYVRKRTTPPSRSALLVVFAVGLGARLLFLGTDPLFSDDVYRYLWDGRVQAAGLSPYGVAPNDASLDAVERDWPPDERVRDRVNHPGIPTIYPPLLELVYRGIAFVHGGLDTWRAFLVVVDGILAAALVGLLKRRSLDARGVALYLWHPLPIVENIWSAHAEVVAVVLLVLAVAALDRSRVFLGGWWVGLGGAAKLLPFGLLPFVVRRYGWRPAVAAGVGASLCLLPFLGVDVEGATVGLRTYADTWYFNDIVFRPLGELIGLDPEDKKLPSTGYWRLALQMAWVGVCVIAMVGGRDVVRVAGAIVLAFVLFTPTLHPWYVVWLLPFAILERSLAGVVFTVTVLFAYEVQIDWQAVNRWEESGWVRVFELAPPIALFLWSWWSRRHRRAV